jgi:hypothetical protein
MHQVRPEINVLEQVVGDVVVESSSSDVVVESSNGGGVVVESSSGGGVVVESSSGGEAVLLKIRLSGTQTVKEKKLPSITSLASVKALFLLDVCDLFLLFFF